MSNIISLEDYKRRRKEKNRDERLTDRSIRTRKSTDKEEPFEAKMFRIKTSLDKINFLLKEIKKREQEEKEKGEDE